MKATVEILVGWREDALPICNREECGVEIKNGDKYVVMPGTIKIICHPCAVELTGMIPPPELLPPVPPPPKPRVRIRKPRPPKPPKPEKQPRSGPRSYVTRAEKPTLDVRTEPAKPATLCAYCGHVVTHRMYRRYPRQFCGRDCTAKQKAKDYEEARQKRGLTRIPCPAGCGKTFQPTIHNGRVQKYCSVPCVGRNSKRLRQKRCPPCGRMFEPSRDSQTYCTKECRRYGREGRVNYSPAPMQWTYEYDKCVDCGTTERTHSGGGQCSRCYVPKKFRSSQEAAG